MINKELLFNSIFFPRPSFKEKDDQDHIVEVAASIYVSIRLFMKDNKFPSILFFHGNAEISQEYDEIASFYNSNNMNFIVADYRGYGFSNGTPNKDNLLSDSSMIFNYVKKILKTNNYKNKIIIMGRSLGSASACEIISQHQDEIDGCIIESGFGTELPILKLLELNLDEIEYDEGDGFQNLSKLKSNIKPIFIIHANDDEIIPVSEAMLMHQNTTSKKNELWIIPNANHNNILMHTNLNYFTKIKRFIDSI